MEAKVDKCLFKSTLETAFMSSQDIFKQHDCEIATKSEATSPWFSCFIYRIYCYSGDIKTEIC